MRRCASKTEYPENWDEIARGRKDEEGWKCERCKHPHDPKVGRCLTVHHLDGDKSNCEKWNIPCLCQKCHLEIQGNVIMSQMLFPFLKVSEWFVWHLEGYKESLK